MGDVILGPNVEIHPTAQINVTERLEIGRDSKVSAGCVIEGRSVTIGNGFWMLPGAVIGGGSCFGPLSSLRAGHYFHMGRNVIVNTSRAVRIGHEVGLGTNTMIFTHGAYLSALEGFPVSFDEVTIGDRVWIPGATVNPGVTIGDDVVIGVGSVVTHDIPHGSLAVGLPARIVREHAYPEVKNDDELRGWWAGILKVLPREVAERITFDPGSRTLATPKALFYLDQPRKVVGVADEVSEALRDELRRHGVRFYASPEAGRYQSWSV